MKLIPKGFLQRSPFSLLNYISIAVHPMVKSLLYQIVLIATGINYYCISEGDICNITDPIINKNQKNNVEMINVR
jgi:hypothetical protein